jgi:hypothetical protein
MDQQTHDTLWRGVTTLAAACGTIDDRFYARQVKLSGNLLVDALNALRGEVTPRLLRDADFALNDLVQLVAELPRDEQEELGEAIGDLRSGLDSLRAGHWFDEELVSRLGELRSKMAERHRAAERAVFLPPEAEREPLPHPPTELSRDVLPLRDALRAGGFETPALDRLADTPDDFLVRDCTAVIDEIDSVVG